MLSAKWVITNKGTVECPKPKARFVALEFVSDAIDRETLFSGTPGLSIGRSLIWRAATLRSSGKIQGNALGCDGVFVWIQRKTALHGGSQHVCTISVRDA